jgi:ubiquinone/menaquinone biosynthesis C-methylase UbiE
MVHEPQSGSRPSPEVVEYRKGGEGFVNVDQYDATRYQSRAARYRQTVMANAYKRMMGSLAGKRVLDVGCGTGRGFAEFAREAEFVVGADASFDMLTVAAGKVSPSPRLGLTNAVAQALPFADASFDIVISLNFLHLFTLETQREMVQEMKRVARPDGVVIIELDNALHGIMVGLYKRWFGDEKGSLPGEIRYMVGDRCRIVRYYGAVVPVLWRIFHRFPALFLRLEKLEYYPPFNRMAHRIYCKIVPTNS